MDVTTFAELLTSRGRDALAAATALNPAEAEFLPHFTALSKQFPRDLARAALEIAITRARARERFGGVAEQLYFTREALEQASHPRVANHRARHFTGCARVVDVCCSVGVDTVALASAGVTTTGVDIDLLRLAMARANLDALNHGSVSLVCADATVPLPLKTSVDGAVFFDPARRKNERRVRSMAAYDPPIDVVHGWLPHFHSVAIKLSPAVSEHDLAPFEVDMGARVEFISLAGQLREATLWLGQRGPTAPRTATVLDDAEGTHSLVADAGGGDAVPTREPGDYLIEPDSAVIRAGLVRTLSRSLDAAQLDPSIAFLTANRPADTAFAKSWRVLDWMPFQLKRLRGYLREHDIGRVTVKRRGSAIEPAALVRDLRLSGNETRLIVLTRVSGRPVVMVCNEMSE